MRTFKVLFKKCIRDILHNWHQFISIIFIIGISVTLFAGLDANAIEFERRVDSVFKQGNIADVWVMINPDFTNTDELDNDLKFLDGISGEKGSIEKRMFVPSNVGSSSATALISDKFPKINTAYDIKSNGYEDKNFFFVDNTVIEKYEFINGKSVNLGDELPVSFQPALIKGMLGGFEIDDELIHSFIDDIAENYELSPTEKTVITTIVENNIDAIKDNLTEIFDEVFTDENLTFNFKVNGIMHHPENVDNGTFVSSNFLLSTRLLVSALLDKVDSKVTSESILNILNDIKDSQETQEATDFYQGIIDWFDEGDNRQTVDTLIGVLFTNLKLRINDGEAESVERIISHLFNQVTMIIDKNLDLKTVEYQINSYYKKKDNNNLLAIMTQSSNGSIAAIVNDITQSRQLTYVFPVIFMIVGVLIVLTTISQLILRDRTQIGTLKALGFNKGQILAYYFGMMNFIGVLGCLLGFIVGPLLIPSIMDIKFTILYNIPARMYCFPWLMASIVLFIIIALITTLTYILIRRELSNSAAESMRPASPNINYSNQIKHKFKHVSLAMALRNMRVHLAKSIMVIIGVLGCTALLICGFGIDDTIVNGKNWDLKNYLNSDLTITLTSGVSRGKGKEELLSYDEVDICEEFTLSQVSISSKNMTISSNVYYFDADSKFFGYDDDLEDGHWNYNKIAISEQKANKLGVKAGDVLTFSVNGEIKTFEIDVVLFAFSVNGIYIYYQTLPDYSSTSTNMWCNLKEGVDASKFKEKLEDESEVIYSILTRQDNNDRIEGYMSSVRMLTGTIKVFAILLAVVVLINISILNFNERKREIATLRVLGFARKEIASSIVYETMMLTTIGATIGLFFGLPMEMLVLGINQVELIYWKYVIFIISYVLAFLISFLTALAVNIVVALRINKVKMAESLKSVE